MEQPAVAVLADDLIWSTRLVDLVRAAGQRPITVRSVPGLTAALPSVSAVIVDLTAPAYGIKLFLAGGPIGTWQEP